MPFPYFSPRQLELRLGEKPYRDLFDEDRDGVADTDAAIQLSTDSSARVKGALRAARRYNLDAIDADTPAEVVRLALDVAELMCCIRYPEVMRKNPEFLQRMVEKELADLVSGKMQLDGAVDPVESPPGTVLVPGRVYVESDCARGW